MEESRKKSDMNTNERVMGKKIDEFSSNERETLDISLDFEDKEISKELEKLEEYMDDEDRRREKYFRASLGHPAKIILIITGVPAVIGLIILFLTDWFIEFDWKWILASFCAMIPFIVIYLSLWIRFLRKDKERFPVHEKESVSVKKSPYHLEAYSPLKTSKLREESISRAKEEIQTSTTQLENQKEIIQDSITSSEDVSKRFLEKIALKDLNENCSVCNSPILENEKYIRCPYCSVPAHFDHMMGWLEQKPICPSCKSRIK